ncbi:MAG: HIT domain-containing protein [Actinobacteria bacterium]|nr:HIT domain-containing protein [Actinomycetota bacterium]
MSHEVLWAAWRNDYVVDATQREREGDGRACVFCAIAQDPQVNEASTVVYADEEVFVVLNRYPYASGHLLICPRRHLASLDELGPKTSPAMWRALEAAVEAVQAAYQPDGINVGANLGKAAGAGIPAHLHLHVLPRWSADTNFMTSVANTRVIPDLLAAAWTKICAAWPLAPAVW